MKKSTIFLTAFLSIIATNNAYAVEFSVSGKITRILSDDNSYGGCMAQLSTAISNGCPGTWVTLDCDGTYIDSNTGERNFATALLAGSQGKSVSLVVDNEKKTNKYCLANRIEIIF